MDYETSIFMFDCREVAVNGVITYSQVRDIFFETMYEDPETKEHLDVAIDADRMDEVSDVFFEAFPKLKKLLEEVGMQVVD